MKHFLFCIVALVSGCADIPNVFNTAQPLTIAYHKPETNSTRVYRFNLTHYPKLEAQIDDIIKNNQTGWRYYYEGLLGESAPYIRVYVNSGLKQVAGISIESDGLLIVRDYDKNFLARYKKDEPRTMQLVNLLEEIIDHEGRSKAEGSNLDEQ